MTPTIDAPGADVSTGDEALFSEIGDALRGEDSTEQTTDQPTETATEQVPPGEAPTPEPGTAQPEATPPGEYPYEATPDGKAYVVPKEELASFTGLKTYADEVQQVFPTANDAKLSHQESSQYRHLLSDYLHGDDKSPTEILKFFAGEYATTPQFRQDSQQAFMRLASAMPEVLKGVSQQAHQQFTESILQSRINDAYEQARANGNPDNPADPLLLQAQRLEWAITGKYRTNDPALRQQFGVDGIQRTDPNQAARDAVTKQQTDLQNREKQLLSRDFQSFNKNEMDGPKWTSYRTEIDKQLASHKDKYQPAVFDAIRAKIDADLRSKLQQDFDWARTHGNERRALEAAYEQAWRSGQPAEHLKQRIQAYQNDFLSRARRYLPSIAKNYLEAATAQAVAQNTQARAQNGRYTNAAPTTAPANGTQQQQNSGRYDMTEDPEWRALWGK